MEHKQWWLKYCGTFFWSNRRSYGRFPLDQCGPSFFHMKVTISSQVIRNGSQHLEARFSNYSRPEVRKMNLQQANDIHTAFRKSVNNNRLACNDHKRSDFPSSYSQHSIVSAKCWKIIFISLVRFRAIWLARISTFFVQRFYCYFYTVLFFHHTCFAYLSLKWTENCRRRKVMWKSFENSTTIYTCLN